MERKRKKETRKLGFKIEIRRNSGTCYKWQKSTVYN